MCFVYAFECHSLAFIYCVRTQIFYFLSTHPPPSACEIRKKPSRDFFFVFPLCRPFLINFTHTLYTYACLQSDERTLYNSVSSLVRFQFLQDFLFSFSLFSRRPREIESTQLFANTRHTTKILLSQNRLVFSTKWIDFIYI